MAATQRAKNARRTTAAFGILTIIAVLICHSIGVAMPVLTVMALCAVAQGIAYLMVRAGQVTAGSLVSIVGILMEHVGVVAAQGVLGPVPYISPLVLLLVAATATSRWLWPALGLTFAALGAEASLSAWNLEDQAAILTSSLFVVMVFVISLMHVRGTERAFEIAQAREQARAEAMRSAAENERLYRLIADNTDDLIAVIDGFGNSRYLSPSHTRVLGLDVEKALGKRASDFLNLHNISDVHDAFTRALEQGEAHVELRIETTVSGARHLDMHMTRVKSGEELLMVTISRDITERKRLQDRIVASERLEALGSLAGSVAHDFNNLLTVIGGAAELAKEVIPSDHRASGEIDAVLDATDTATRLTAQLLTFSKRQIALPVPLDLKRALTGQQELLQRMVGRKVRLEFRLSGDLPPVCMPSSHFEQLAMNLSVNARDAMPEGGTLTFFLEQVNLRAGEYGVTHPGKHVALSVMDEGTGIPDEVLPHLFEPSFTTKRSGSGLGLATCQSIVAQLGGGIDVQTEEGKGTKFRFFLPASSGTPKTRASLDAVSIREVLVVDDDTSVRETTARMLLSRGFRVRTAESLRQARSILEDPTNTVEALVTDVVLSDERGTDLLETCRRHRPSATIVVMSGYTPDPKAATILESHGARFVAKPFSAEQLLEALGVAPIRTSTPTESSRS